MELRNRTILITGGTSGIGFALAKALLEKNNTVIVCSRNQEKLETAKEILPSLNIIRCDIANTEDLNDLVSTISSQFPRLDTLINNAGIQNQVDLTKGNCIDKKVCAEIDTNLTAHINITHRLYSLLKTNNNPAIIFVSSALGLAPKFDSPIYSAAKAGLHSFVHSIRHHSKPDGIKIFEVFPDVTETAMTQERTDEKKMSVKEFTECVLTKLTKHHHEIYVGRTKVVSFLNRLAPSFARSILNR